MASSFSIGQLFSLVSFRCARTHADTLFVCAPHRPDRPFLCKRSPPLQCQTLRLISTHRRPEPVGVLSRRSPNAGFSPHHPAPMPLPLRRCVPRLKGVVLGTMLQTCRGCRGADGKPALSERCTWPGSWTSPCTGGWIGDTGRGSTCGLRHSAQERRSTGA